MTTRRALATNMFRIRNPEGMTPWKTLHGERVRPIKTDPR
jgi:hypothetical protein